MSLRIAQCTSSSQQSVTGSIFQRPHGKKAPQNGHHRFGVNGHVEIQTFFPPGPQHINQGNEMNGMAHEMMIEVPPSSLVGKLVFGITNCQTTQLVVD